MRVAFIGGGAWGLALARLLAVNSHEVLVWEHNPKWLKSLIDTRSNPVLLPDVIMPENVGFTGSMVDLASFSPEVIVLATPTQFLRSTIGNIDPQTASALWGSPKLKAIVNVAKGMEEGSLKRIDQILMDELPESAHDKICALSGPSHAEEVSRQIPTTVVVAGSDPDVLLLLQEMFSNDWFRVYRTDDLIGVEIGGSVKNIISIAAGIVAGLDFGDNTMGALLTRGIVEIIRLGTAMGAQADTFMGLSGIGDLITTAISPHSRNRFVGYHIGKGKKLSEVLATMDKVAEGVATTRSIHEIAAVYNVEMPITNEVYKVLFEDKSPEKAIRDLMTRELKQE